jgi:hypothetical protein
MRLRIAVAISLSLAAATARDAAAQQAPSTQLPPGAGTTPPRAAGADNSTAGRDREFPHPYGTIEFGIGVLALPDARVCGEAGCDRGDVSLEVDASPLFRASPSFAVGAGMMLALTPTQDVPQGDQAFPRDHSRRYFQAEGIGRYYLAHGRTFELWAGLSAGLVVVSDNFKTHSAPLDVALIGGESANIATEGVSVGLATGVTFGVNDALQVGGTLRFANWFLPSAHQSISFYEEASLGDRVTMINLALVVAYHGGP